MTAVGKQQGSLINLAALLPISRSNGPGRRAVVWVQGCERNCSGCFNQDMRLFVDKELIAPAELADRILAIDSIEGVTFSGGEPFMQAKALAVLAEQLRTRGLNIVIFTGYTLAELTTGNNPDWARLLAVADLLIAGTYEQQQPSQKYLRASANQQLVFLTERLKQHPDIVDSRGQTAEIVVDAAGNVIMTGLEEILKIR